MRRSGRRRRRRRIRRRRTCLTRLSVCVPRRVMVGNSFTIFDSTTMVLRISRYSFPSRQLMNARAI
jgi:hypothetical protein